MTPAFVTYVRGLREKSGLSQTEIAAKLELKSGQLVSNWERGQCYPPLLKMPALAEMYGVKLEVFYDRYRKSFEQRERAKIGI